MNRRTVLFGAGLLSAWPLLAQAQQPAMPVLGYLSFLSADATAESPLFNGLHQGLGEAGFVKGKNLAVEYRFADFKANRASAQLADLVERRVAVIYANGPAATLAVKAATPTIPVVFSFGGDPVKAGLVASLSRPAGNVTGVTLLTTELGPKRLELLRELVPSGSMIAVLVIPDDPDSQTELQQVQRAAQSLGQKIHVVRAISADDFEAAFHDITQQHCAALLVSTGGLFGNNARQLATLTERYAIPAIFDRRGSVDAGGLISYGTNFAEVGRQAGILVGRVLKGEKPADLPVEQPTKFELVVNLKTAKALGLTIPRSLLARADEVIE